MFDVVNTGFGVLAHFVVMCEMLDLGTVPIVPEQGSLGASGDLAPRRTWPSR